MSFESISIVDERLWRLFDRSIKRIQPDCPITFKLTEEVELHFTDHRKASKYRFFSPFQVGTVIAKWAAGELKPAIAPSPFA